MKLIKLIPGLLLISLLLITTAFKAPDSSIFTLLERDSFAVTTKSEVDYRFFLDSGYDKSQERMEFITRETTSQIRVYDKFGVQEFILPVDADKVILNKSMFKSGDYTLVFDVESDRTLYRTYLEIF